MQQHQQHTQCTLSGERNQRKQERIYANFKEGAFQMQHHQQHLQYNLSVSREKSKENNKEYMQLLKPVQAKCYKELCLL